MLKKLPIKKIHLLIAGTLLLTLLSYQLAFKKTWEAWLSHRELQRQLNSPDNLSVQPDYIVRKRHNLDSVLTFYQADTTLFRSNILTRIALIAAKRNVRLSEVPVDNALLHTPQFVIQRLDFEGDFFALTRTLNDLSATKSIGVARSVTFRTTRAADMLSQKLVMELYFEILK